MNIHLLAFQQKKDIILYDIFSLPFLTIHPPHERTRFMMKKALPLLAADPECRFRCSQTTIRPGAAADLSPNHRQPDQDETCKSFVMD